MYAELVVATAGGDQAFGQTGDQQSALFRPVLGDELEDLVEIWLHVFGCRDYDSFQGAKQVVIVAALGLHLELGVGLRLGLRLGLELGLGSGLGLE